MKGAGKGYKGGKDSSPPTPGKPEPSPSPAGISGPPTESGVANLAASSESVDNNDTGGLFFI